MNDNQNVKRYHPEDISSLWMDNSTELQFLNTGEIDKFVRESDYESLLSKCETLEKENNRLKKENQMWYNDHIVSRDITKGWAKEIQSLKSQLADINIAYKTKERRTSMKVKIEITADTLPELLHRLREIRDDFSREENIYDSLTVGSSSSVNITVIEK